MSISTYSELVAAVTNWLSRSDLTVRVPEFIALGEAYLNREIKTQEQLQSTSLTTSTSVNYVSLPTRCLEVDSLYHSNGESLTPASLDSVTSSRIGGMAGRPKYYCITDRIELDLVPDQAYTLTCLYRKNLDIATDSTNWLLTKWPDAYLYASLLQAMPYLRNDVRMATIEPMLTRTINSINALGIDRPALRVDDALMATNSWKDITTFIN